MANNGNAVKYADIAKAAGVSSSKVCRAMSGRSDISEAEAKRIRAIAEEMGYRGNRLASSVKTGKSRIIGCLINQLTNPYNNELMAGMEEAASRYDYAVIFTDGTSHIRHKIERLLSYQMDVFIMTFTPGEEEMAEMISLELAGCPRLASQPISIPGWGEVSVDHALASETLVDHLAALGHKHIGFACGVVPSGENNPRLQGFMDRMERHGFGVRGDWVLVSGAYPDTLEGGFAAGAAYLSMIERPTAVIAHNDASAMGLTLAFRNGGLRVPEDISVCGFDGLSLFKPMVPALTTIDTHNFQWGHRLIEVAIEMAETKSVIKDRFRWDLRLGGTTGPCGK